MLYTTATKSRVYIPGRVLCSRKLSTKVGTQPSQERVKYFFLTIEHSTGYRHFNNIKIKPQPQPPPPSASSYRPPPSRCSKHCIGNLQSILYESINTLGNVPTFQKAFWFGKKLILKRKPSLAVIVSTYSRHFCVNTLKVVDE